MWYFTILSSVSFWSLNLTADDGLYSDNTLCQTIMIVYLQTVFQSLEFVII